MTDCRWRQTLESSSTPPGVLHPGQRVVIADVRDHLLVAHVVGACREQAALFLGEDLGVEVPGNRKLGIGPLQLSRTREV
jgi:hypothetical protein